MPATVDPRALQGVELFDNLTTQQAGEILVACSEILCTAGRVIFESGHFDRGLFMLLVGML